MRVPGEIITKTKRGVTIRYSPRQGSSRKYDVVCPHGTVVLDRTLADARESASDPGDWCVECKYNEPTQERTQ